MTHKLETGQIYCRNVCANQESDWDWLPKKQVGQPFLGNGEAQASTEAITPRERHESDWDWLPMKQVGQHFLGNGVAQASTEATTLTERHAYEKQWSKKQCIAG